MMGSAMAMLAGVAQITTGAATPGDNDAAQGADFLGALLAAAPVPVDPAAAATLLPAAPQAEAAAPDSTTSAEIAALIAAMLPVAATADAVPTDTPEVAAAGSQAAGSQLAGSAAASARAHEQLLQLLALEAGSTAEQQQAPVAPGTTDAAAARLPPDAGLHQLLRAMTPRAAQPAPQVTMPRPGSAKGGDPAPAFAASLATADVALHAPELSATAVVGTQQLEITPLTAEIQAPTPTQSQSATQPQPQPSVLALSQQPQAATPAVAQTVHIPVGAPRWAEELGSRMMLMTVSGHHEGSLNLTPDHLGPLEVRVSVNQGTTNVWFGAQHADTRAALAEALPRLRELFAEAGLVLGHAGVSQEAPRQGQHSGEAQQLAAAAPASTIEGTDAAAPEARRVALGLIDTYV